MLYIDGLKTEHLENPIGIETSQPRLSWNVNSDLQEVYQVAYRVIASLTSNYSETLWDSGKVVTSKSQNIPYSGPELRSEQGIYWKVKLWLNARNENKENIQYELESKSAYFEMGLLDINDWIANWILPEKDIDKDSFKPAPYIRREFNIKKGLLKARAYMSAKGLYQFYINGKLGSEDVFTPGYTSYYNRIQYQTYDITHLLSEGRNALGIILGDGWWRGCVGMFDFNNNFGYEVAYIGQLHITYEDGSQEIISSDESFKASTGPILKSDLKYGEIYDGRLEINGWNQIGFNDDQWSTVKIEECGKEILVGSSSLPIRQKERFVPRLIHTPKGQKVLDFGQNINGWIECRLSGKVGDSVTLIHGETLDKEGNFTLDNIGFTLNDQRGFQSVTYTLGRDEAKVYHPHFSMFGFRYVWIKEFFGTINPEDYTGIAIYTNMEETGDFECSNEKINQLVSNSRWSQKGNFLDVPTDCPTRERAAWTGDAQLYCKTATLFMDVYPFFEKWMTDLKAEQFDNGTIGITVPGVDYHSYDEYKRVKDLRTDLMFPLIEPGVPGFVSGSAGWGDAAVIIPWTMYQVYGDIEILKRQYASAKAWVDFMDQNEAWETKFHFGEWLEADGYEESPEDKALVALAFYGYSSHIMSKIAHVLGKESDKSKYKSIFEKVKVRYNEKYINDDGWIIRNDGSVVEDRQSPYIKVLAFNLVNPERTLLVAKHLNHIIKNNDYHLNTGFLSTPFILKVLVDNGYKSTAFKLLEQESSPSWLYAVTKGATTIWEHWDGITPEGDIEASFNHYAYGAVCDFLFSYICGIQPLKPGYETILIKPVIGGSLTYAKARYKCAYGEIISSWRIKEDKTIYVFKIPDNTSASIYLECSEEAFQAIDKLSDDMVYEDGYLTVALGSGEYKIII